MSKVSIDKEELEQLQAMAGQAEQGRLQLAEENERLQQRVVAVEKELQTAREAAVQSAEIAILADRGSFRKTSLRTMIWIRDHIGEAIENSDQVSTLGDFISELAEREYGAVVRVGDDDDESTDDGITFADEQGNALQLRFIGDQAFTIALAWDKVSAITSAVSATMNPKLSTEERAASERALTAYRSEILKLLEGAIAPAF